MTANPTKAAVAQATIALQCSEGRFDLVLDIMTTLLETKRTFKRTFPALGSVNLSAFVISCNGKFFSEETVTLKSLGAEADSEVILFLVKRKDIPSLNPTEEA